MKRKIILYSLIQSKHSTSKIYSKINRMSIFVYSLTQIPPTLKKLSFLPNEKWAVIQLPEANLTKQYAVSNLGRIATFIDDIENGSLLKTQNNDKRQPRFSIRINGKNTNRVVSVEVATHFLPKPTEDSNCIIHIDGNINNNQVDNLKWVTEGIYKQNMLNRIFSKPRKGTSGKNGDQQVVKIFPTEEIRILEIPDLTRKYAVTSFGRLISFFSDIEKDGIVMGLSMHEEGYKIWRYKQKNKPCHMLLHRLVATHFLQKPSEDHKYVIHKDHNKLNNVATNLKWVTLEEKTEHINQSEHIVKNNIRNATAEELAKRGYKLTESKVRIIKKILFDRKRTTRLKMIAKQFGITPMQLRRIQTGENWGWVEA